MGRGRLELYRALFPLAPLRERKLCVPGIEFYRQMKEMDGKVNVCFITASELYFYEEITKEVFPELGVSRIIRKPISIDDLVEYLKEELGTIRCC